MKMEAKEAKKNTKKPNLFIRLVNSPYTIMVALAILCIGALGYNRYMVKTINLYSFHGYTKDFSFLNGTIYTSYDINYFGDTKVIYTGEDIMLHDFKVGYYVKDGKNYHVISEFDDLESALEEGASVSLKELVEKTDFSFSEIKRDAQYLTKDTINNLKSLVFRITGVDTDGKDVDIEIEMVVNKRSK